MAEVVHADLLEQILLRSEVKDLIRFKSVCKSWHSVITSSGFINRHLNRSYNKDRHNYEIGHRRIRLTDGSGSYTLVGSSNGLVCIISYLRIGEVLVGNPLTRELRQLPLSTIDSPSCRGFGYDSSTDDYTVLVGAKNGKNRTCVQVLSLKSNEWKVIGEVMYTFMTADGVFCNGALHWIVRDQNSKRVIISYDLSKEQFKEIPQPEGEGCLLRYSWSSLGNMKECLCIMGYSNFGKVWMMKKYNVKQSWELLPRHREIIYTIVHSFSIHKDEIFFDFKSKSSWDWDYVFRVFIMTPIFVKSLVSP
ncbi:putative F-box domain, galactose oxidase/kelch, beta-propeller, F-box associated interaction [Helianthus annuus]|nr:putative F-box domain, galactose oxidase/kelch, beta-propeller, F-box associated interaction [Helianthus annuus]